MNYFNTNYFLQKKVVVAAQVVMSQFDNNMALKNYTLQFIYQPLGWLDLLNLFAFDLNFYIAIFLAIGVSQV